MVEQFYQTLIESFSCPLDEGTADVPMEEQMSDISDPVDSAWQKTWLKIKRGVRNEWEDDITLTKFFLSMYATMTMTCSLIGTLAVVEQLKDHEHAQDRHPVMAMERQFRQEVGTFVYVHTIPGRVLMHGSAYMVDGVLDGAGYIGTKFGLRPADKEKGE
jgi:hypothetical protein